MIFLLRASLLSHGRYARSGSRHFKRRKLITAGSGNSSYFQAQINAGIAMRLWCTRIQLASSPSSIATNRVELYKDAIRMEVIGASAAIRPNNCSVRIQIGNLPGKREHVKGIFSHE